MLQALQTIAGFYNPAATQDGGQAAARLARETIADLGFATAPTQASSDSGA